MFRDLSDHEVGSRQVYNCQGEAPVWSHWALGKVGRDGAVRGTLLSTLEINGGFAV